jgi:exodeoxyribonuclease V beta subunit
VKVTTMLELDHLTIDLAGTNLIEASAGTGKTYAIACLYLRLLIEKRLTPEQILVVTYTEAATKELRGRIRARIRQALAVLDGADSTDSFLLGLAANDNGLGSERHVARDLLQRALHAFDTAAIFTIHGFCLRALQDNAFESGSLYDTELLADQNALLLEVVEDFWRQRFFTEPAPLLAHALRHRFSPTSFMQFLKSLMLNPKVQITPQFSPAQIQRLEGDCQAAFAKVQQHWLKAQGEITDILHHHKGLSRSEKQYRPDKVHSLLDGMVSFLAGDNLYDLFEGFDKFCTASIDEQQLKKNPPPGHDFFDLCQDLQIKVEERFLALRWELVEFCRQRLPERKRQGNIRFFDDLLNDLYQALHAGQSDALAALLRSRYRAALIDEFQDTDPVQYDIFRRIFAEADTPLFLIGDPKQAIYSFRGADIFAYLEAAGQVPAARRFTLTDNWRSIPELLTAFNTVFTTGAEPFVFADIAYHPLKSGRLERAPELLDAEGGSAALQLWCLPAAEGGEALNIGQANELVPAAVATEVVRLLRAGVEGRARIGDRPVLPEDLAVIVRSHRQGRLVQEALRQCGIPCVMRSEQSIFATDEARQVCALLQGIAEPGREGKVRAALLTDLLGCSGNDIAALLDDEQGWEDILQKFRDYHHLWLERGFMIMAQKLLAAEGVRGRLLGHTDGERRLTNVLHCLEIIHQQAHERGLGSEGLLTWFAERIASGEAADEYQMRLETDEKAVKIVTIHLSKGLEYPIVFCPFMWGGLRDGDEVLTLHLDFAMIKDFGSSDYQQNRRIARKEALAESLRLLYVALTRAKYRCYLVGGKVTSGRNGSNPQTSPLAYLFHGGDGSATQGDLVEELASAVGSLPASALEGQLQAVAARGEGSISVGPLPNAAGAGGGLALNDDQRPLAHRQFSGSIVSDWRVASFTSFTAHEGPAIELPDRDESRGEVRPAATLIGEAPEELSIFTFPRGAQAGIFLHELFEGLDYAAGSAESVQILAGKGLEKHGYEQKWLPHIAANVQAVLATPLSTVQGSSFILGGLQPGSWLMEMEFFFPLQFITTERLAGCLRQWGHLQPSVDLGRLCAALHFKPVQGMVRGFMDMVFEEDGRYYLLDWKSNHLGYRLEDYRRPNLQAAMEQHLYPLQYLLYAVALNRYLSLRVKGYDYNSHFGGVIYVFLRGVNPQRGEEFGFFRDLPPVELIEELTRCLIAAGG